MINLSLGDFLPGEILHDPAVDDAIRDAYLRGSVVVAAAGNDGFPFSNPATADVSLVVGATGPSDERASYSNAGPGVRLWAPGGETGFTCGQDALVWSTVIRGRGGCGQQDYDQYGGTSMAAPHVSGVAALVRSINPSLVPKQVMDLLISTADSVGLLGLKRVNAAKAVASAVSQTPGGGGGTSSPTGPAVSPTPAKGGSQPWPGSTTTSGSGSSGGEGEEEELPAGTTPAVDGTTGDPRAGQEPGAGDGPSLWIAAVSLSIAVLAGAAIGGRYLGRRSRVGDTR